MAPGDFNHDRDVYWPLWRLLRRVLSVYSIPAAALPPPDGRKDA